MLTGPLHELDFGVIPSPSGASALVLHAEESADCLVVLIVWRSSDQSHRTAIVTYSGCTQSVFGYPNDEAYWAVPGTGYGFYEVRSTEWAERVEAFNSLRFPGAEERMSYGRPRHFFLGCHDTSGQFLAQDVDVEVFEEDYGYVLNEALQRVGAITPDGPSVLPRRPLHDLPL